MQDGRPKLADAWIQPVPYLTSHVSRNWHVIISFNLKAFFDVLHVISWRFQVSVIHFLLFICGQITY